MAIGFPSLRSPRGQTFRFRTTPQRRRRPQVGTPEYKQWLATEANLRKALEAQMAVSEARYANRLRDEDYQLRLRRMYGGYERGPGGEIFFQGKPLETKPEPRPGTGYVSPYGGRTEAGETREAFMQARGYTPEEIATGKETPEGLAIRRLREERRTEAEFQRLMDEAISDAAMAAQRETDPARRQRAQKDLENYAKQYARSTVRLRELDNLMRQQEQQGQPAPDALSRVLMRGAQQREMQLLQEPTPPATSMAPEGLSEPQKQEWAALWNEVNLDSEMPIEDRRAAAEQLLRLEQQARLTPLEPDLASRLAPRHTLELGRALMRQGIETPYFDLLANERQRAEQGPPAETTSQTPATQQAAVNLVQNLRATYPKDRFLKDVEKILGAAPLPPERVARIFDKLMDYASKRATTARKQNAEQLEATAREAEIDARTMLYGTNPNMAAPWTWPVPPQSPEGGWVGEGQAVQISQAEALKRLKQAWKAFHAKWQGRLPEGAIKRIFYEVTTEPGTTAIGSLEWLARTHVFGGKAPAQFRRPIGAGASSDFKKDMADAVATVRAKYSAQKGRAPYAYELQAEVEKIMRAKGYTLKD